jgi:hypothetical protein
MTDQTFTYVTLSQTGTTPKLRFTNNAMTRTKRLKDSKVSFMKLPKAMTKIEAANWVVKHPGDSDKDQLEKAVARVTARFTPKPVKAVKPKAAAKPKAEKPVKAAKPKASAKPKAPRAKKAAPKVENEVEVEVQVEDQA